MLLTSVSLFLDLRGDSLTNQALPPKVDGKLYSEDPLHAIDDGLWFAVNGESFFQNSKRVGVVVADSEATSPHRRNIIYDAIRRPEDYLTLLDDSAVLFDFALATAQHCRQISGCKTTIVCECRTEAEVDALLSAAREDEVGVPLAVLTADASLWSRVLRLSGGAATPLSMHADTMAQQALSGLTQPYPHKADHLWLEDDGPLLSPQELHPVFFGSYDWHSSVHSHWCLVRLLRRCPEHVDAAAIEAALLESVQSEACLVEAAYFRRKGASTFERPYGWGWLLMLAGECALAKEESMRTDAACAAHHNLFDALSSALEPIVYEVREGWLAYLPKLGFPVRSGVHSNSAFGLTLSHCYASAVGDTALLEAINMAATRLYGSDYGYDPSFEPSGEDFLSCAGPRTLPSSHPPPLCLTTSVRAPRLHQPWNVRDGSNAACSPDGASVHHMGEHIHAFPRARHRPDWGSYPDHADHLGPDRRAARASRRPPTQQGLDHARLCHRP